MECGVSSSSDEPAGLSVCECVCVSARASQALAPTRTHTNTLPRTPRVHTAPRARAHALPDTHTHSDHTYRSGREPGWLRRQRGAGGGESPAAGGAREPRAVRTVPAELARAAAPSGGRRSCRSRARRPAHPLQSRPTPPRRPEGFGVPAGVARRLREPASGPRTQGGRAAGGPRAPEAERAGSAIRRHGQPLRQASRAAGAAPLQPAPVLPPHVRSASCSLQPAACRTKTRRAGPGLGVGVGKIAPTQPRAQLRVPHPGEGPVNNERPEHAHTDLDFP